MLISNVDYFLSWVVHFLLVVTRVSMLFVMTPLLSRQNIPNAAKIGLSLLVGMIVVNFTPPPAVYPYDNIYALAFAVLCEAAAGLVIGFITMLFFNVVYTAAHIIDMQIGFSMSQMYDASTGGQVAVTSGLLNTVLIVSFIFSRGGFTQLIVTVTRTFDIIPVGGGILRPEITSLVLECFVRCFLISIQVSMPVLAAALLAEVALGVVVRTSPQMNVFVIGIPIKVLLGLMVLVMMLPVFINFSNVIFSQMFSFIDRALGGMIP